MEESMKDKRRAWCEPQITEITVKLTNNSVAKPGVHDDGNGMSNGDAAVASPPSGSI